MMTEDCTGLPTPLRESASDTPARLPQHLTCTKAWPGTTPRQTNCRKIQQWTDKPILERFAEHLAGAGAVLTREVARAGIAMTLARTWPDTTKDREDSLKHQGGARRFCPECGVKPAASRLASDKPPGRLSCYELERLGTTLDGTPLPVVTTYPSPAAAQAAPGEETEMFGRGRRAAARERAAQRAEADALFAEADRQSGLAAEPADFRREITRERAARIRERLGEDLVRDARAPDVALGHWAICAGDVAAVAGGAGPQRGHEPEPRGAQRDAEIGRLAVRFGEPELWERGPDAATWRAAEAGAQADGSGLQGGLYPGPEGPGEWPAAWDGLMARSNSAEAARERENAAAAAQRVALGEQREHPGPQAYAAAIAAGRDLREAWAAHVAADATVYAAAARLQEAAIEPDGLPRLLDQADAAPRAPEAWRLADGTPHTDPVLAARGWQAQGGVYRRVPQAEPEMEAG
jgi:hypothetical protein